MLLIGGGKTLLAFALAVLEQQQAEQQAEIGGITILVVPYRALIQDMLVRLGQASIQAAEWKSGVEGDYQNRRTLAAIVLVSADHVGSSSRQFLSYASLLARQGVLRRVVIDESHVAITADSWRTKLRNLKDIRLLPCQQVLLTATLPPSQERQLQEVMLIRGATMI